jgi:CheY-like chemotaxis protein
MQPGLSIGKRSTRLNLLMLSSISKRLYRMMPQNDSTAQPQQNVPSMKKRTALIVDDGELIRRTTSYLLLRLNFDIATASDGYRGIQLALQLIPDIIILDIWMPQLDGLQVLQILKSQEKTKSIPVIVITGHDDENKIQEALSFGATCVLRKPLKERIIFSILRDIFGSEFDGFTEIGKKEAEPMRTDGQTSVNGEDEAMLTFLKKQFVLLYIPRIKKMMELVSSRELKGLHRLVHDIKGSAGTVGYADVTEKAASVEAILKKESIDWTAVTQAADILCRRIEEVQFEVENL